MEPIKLMYIEKVLRRENDFKNCSVIGAVEISEYPRDLALVKYTFLASFIFDFTERVTGIASDVSGRSLLLSEYFKGMILTDVNSEPSWVRG